MLAMKREDQNDLFMPTPGQLDDSCQKVLDALKNAGQRGLTMHDAVVLGLTNTLSRRVCDLISMGHNIDRSQWKTLPSGKRVKKYMLRTW